MSSPQRVLWMALEAGLLNFNKRQTPALQQVLQVTLSFLFDTGGFRRLVDAGVREAELLAQPRHIASRGAQGVMESLSKAP